MLENVQKGLCMPLFEYAGRVSIIKTQQEKLITEITNFNNFKSCIFDIFGTFYATLKLRHWSYHSLYTVKTSSFFFR